MTAAGAEQEEQVPHLLAQWPMGTVGDVFDIQQGKALSAAARGARDRYPFLRTTNVLWNRIDISSIDAMGMSEQERSRLALRPGDLLVCEGGEIGRSAVWNGEIDECFYQNHIHRLRRRHDASPEFFAFWLRYAFTMTDLYRGAGTKTTIANLSMGRLSALRIPFPPVDEQRRIARILVTIQRAQEALTRSLSTIPPLEAAMRHEVAELGTEWRQVELGDVAAVSTGATPPTNETDYWAGDIPFVRTSEISGDVISRAAAHVSALAVADGRTRVFPAGTVFVAMYGQGKTRGNVALLAIDAATSQNTGAIACHRNLLDPEFLFHHLKGRYESLRGEGVHGHISHLNVGFLKKIRIPCPPLENQQHFVRALRTLYLETRRSLELAQCLEAIRNSTMASLFGGQG